jgi:hypothetical protein
MSSRNLDERLKQLSALADAPEAEAIAGLRRALESKPALAVARAAKIAAKRNLTALVDDVERAFDRFLALPPEQDRGALAKQALVDACDELGSRQSELFIRAARCVHRELALGRTTERAGGVRARALFALFRLQHPQAIHEAARELAGEDAGARVGAADAMANANALEAVPLLRFKALIGDEQAAVSEAVLTSLLALDPESSLDFVADFLSSADEAQREIAAMALGASRLDGAATRLIRWANTLDDSRARIAYAAIALLRSARSSEYLIGEIAHASTERAVLAVAALGPFSFDAELVRRMREAAGDRRQLQAAIDQLHERR